MTNAIVVVNYDQVLHSNSRESFLDAAKRWKCEFFEINEMVFTGPIPAPTVKLRAFELCDADRIFLLDADTVLSAATPSPFDTFPEDVFIACINKQVQLGQFVGKSLQIERQDIQLIVNTGFFGEIGFDHTQYFNTGMWLGSREHHASLLFRALEIAVYTPNLTYYEKSPLNYIMAESVQKGEAKLELVDTTWNYCYPPNLQDWLNMKKYVYHFTNMSTCHYDIPRVNWRV